MNRDNRSTNSNNYSSVAPPPNINRFTPRVNVSALPNPLLQYKSTPKFGSRKRTVKEDDDYFNDDDEDHACDDSYKRSSSQRNIRDDDDDDDRRRPNDQEDEEEDPFDAFMADINKQLKEGKGKEDKRKSSIPSSSLPTSSSQRKDLKSIKGVRGDIDEEDVEESYYRYIEENPTASASNSVEDSLDDPESIEYDADGNPIYKKVKYIDPLPPIDHSTIEYRPFARNFYIEHEEIKRLLPNQVSDLRKKLNVKVLGVQTPSPVISFAHFNFDEQLMKIIRKCEYSQPTPIQAQAIPVALSGRDLIGIAKTGSGKTAAFIWPMLIHIMDQTDLKAGDGPIGLILAPTRELSQQIYAETKKFAKAYNIRAVCTYGGGSKWEQQQDLEQGAEIVIATPGRLIDLIKAKATNLARVTMLVLDEADRMFAMGFEAQVRSICDHCRSDRQTLMFSATFQKRIERLARDALSDPIKIIQGELGEANQDVQQIVHVLPTANAKFEWLCSHLTALCSAGSVLIFVTQKNASEELAANLRVREIDLELIHGDFDQATRNKVISRFKRKEVDLLIATDVAARGLDISHVRTVINYDTARDIDTHTHRIGRTGRAGVSGVAHTLVTDKDKEFAGHLVRNLELSNQTVPDDLMRLAMQSQWFKKSRFKNSKAKDLNKSGGLGLRRPGLGSQPDRSTRESSRTDGKSMTLSGYNNSGHINTGQQRMEAIRSAYATQMKNSFRPASTSTLASNFVPASNTSQPAPSNDDAKAKKRSRWQ